jgi:hypothetical protein
MHGKGKLAALIASGMAVAAIAVAVSLLAPGATLAAQTPATVNQAGFPGKGGGPDDTYLADALGITAEDLTAARQKAYEAAVQKALDEGSITEAQAEALRNHGGRGLGMLLRWGGNADVDADALLADALGISIEKLRAAGATAAAARLDQAVKDGKVTREQADLMKARQALRQYIEDKGLYEEAVKRAVQDGVLTQEQADAILSARGRMGGFGPGGFHGHGARGGFRGHGGFGMPPGGAPPQRAPTGQSSDFRL